MIRMAFVFIFFIVTVVTVSDAGILFKIPYEIGSVFAISPLTKEEGEFVRSHGIDVIMHNSSPLIGPFRYKNDFAYYLNHEVNISSMSRVNSAKKIYLELFNHIPYGSTVIISPYIFNTSIEKDDFRTIVYKFYKSLLSRRPDIKLVSAVQDGVGCSHHPKYVEWGYKDRSIYSISYFRLLDLLKVHREVCESLGVVAQVNIELFEYSKEKRDWVFADPNRIYYQIALSGHASSQSRLGPCWSLNGMSPHYDSSTFIRQYRVQNGNNRPKQNFYQLAR